MAVNNGIVSNFIANSTISNANKAQNDIATSAKRLSTGNKITKASDDVAGLIASEFMKGQQVQIAASLKNIGQADSLLSTATQSLNQMQQILNRQSDLATQTKSSALNTDIKLKVQQEFNQLSEELNRVAKETNFNQIKLLDGSQYAPNSVTTDTFTDPNNIKSAKRTEANLIIATAFDDTNAADNGGHISVNGARIYLRNGTDMNVGVSDLNVNIETNSTKEEQAEAIYNKLKEIQNYSGDNLAVIRAKEKLDSLDFSYPGNEGTLNDRISIKARTAGAYADTIQIAGSNFGAGAANVDGTTIDNASVDLASTSRSNSVTGKSGSLNGGYSSTLSASGTINITTAFAVGDDGNSISINGAQFNLHNTANFGAATAIEQTYYGIDVQAGATTGDAQISALLEKIDSIMGYEGTDTTVKGMQDKLKDLEFSANGSSLRITSRLEGGAGNIVKIAGSNFTTGVANLDGANIDNATLDLATEFRGTYYTAAEETAIKTGGTKASGTLKISAAYTVANDAGDTISINGAVFTMKNGAAAAGRPDEIDISAVTTAATQAAALKDAFDAVKSYTGTDATVLGYKDKLADLEMNYEAGTDLLKITSTKRGDTDANSIKIEKTATTDGALLVNGIDMGAGVASADLASKISGNYAISATADMAKTEVRGQVTHSVLKDLTTNSNTTGIDVSGVSNNADFVGKISGFKATKVSGEDHKINLEIKIGDYTYKANNVNTKPETDTSISLVSQDPQGGYFKIRLNSDVNTNVYSDSEAQSFADKINRAFEGIDIYQNRDVASFDSAKAGLIKDGSETIGDLDGTSWKMFSDNFTNVQMERIKISAPKVGESDAKIEVTINGETFTSEGGIGNKIAANGEVVLRNGQSTLKFTNGATELKLDNESKAAAASKAFMTAFGVNNGGTSMVFQVGTAPSDKIEFKLKSMLADDMYGMDYTKMDLTTIEGSEAALAAIKNATEVLNENLGTVGAAQSRFQYAANNLEALQQTIDSARGTFADTNMAEESVSYAGATVRYNASLSLLAQVNQLGQSLLKVLG